MSRGAKASIMQKHFLFAALTVVFALGASVACHVNHDADGGSDPGEAVDAGPPPVITTANVPNAEVQTEYSETLKATGGSGALLWTLEDAAVDLDWLRIDHALGTLKNEGQISRTAGSPGLGFTVRVQDATGRTASRQLFLQVICKEGKTTDCFIGGDQETCLKGTTVCTNGATNGACSNPGKSNVISRCGSDGGVCTACVPDQVSGCDGVCMCGAGTACTGEQTCCTDAGTSACADLIQGDTANCGHCGGSCADEHPGQVHVAWSCGDSHCSRKCDPVDFDDCDGQVETGCETNIKSNDVKHCGSCTHDCNATTITANSHHTCTGSTCGFECDGGFFLCNDLCLPNANSDVNNCGSCGNLCGAVHTTGGPTCSAGVCGYEGGCAGAFLDCDGVKSNGCEVLPNTTAHCDSCFPCPAGDRCSPVNGCCSGPDCN